MNKNLPKNFKALFVKKEKEKFRLYLGKKNFNSLKKFYILHLIIKIF